MTTQDSLIINHRLTAYRQDFARCNQRRVRFFRWMFKHYNRLEVIVAD